jgi:hypothetical protein
MEGNKAYQQIGGYFRAQRIGVRRSIEDMDWLLPCWWRRFSPDSESPAAAFCYSENR